MKLKKFFLPLLLSLSTSFCLQSAQAQPFPNKPLRLVVPYPAGGPVDFIARSLQPELAKVWGQPVVIDNIGGGSGMAAASPCRSQNRMAIPC